MGGSIEPIMPFPPHPLIFMAVLSLTAVSFSTAQTASRIEKLANQPTLQPEIALDEIVESSGRCFQNRRASIRRQCRKNFIAHAKVWMALMR